MEKTEGVLQFDINFGRFGIAVNDDSTPDTPLNFGDEFEVKIDGKWIPTALDITSDKDNNLQFKLRNTPYAGDLNGFEVRK